MLSAIQELYDTNIHVVYCKKTHSKTKRKMQGY